MSLQLLKIQEGAGVATGAVSAFCFVFQSLIFLVSKILNFFFYVAHTIKVLYHALKELTPEERAELKRRRQEKVALKAARYDFIFLK